MPSPSAPLDRDADVSYRQGDLGGNMLRSLLHVLVALRFIKLSSGHTR